MRGNYRPTGHVENYTNAFLVSFYAVLLIGLVAVWAMFGFIDAVLVACVINLYLHRRRLRRLAGQ